MSDLCLTCRPEVDAVLLELAAQQEDEGARKAIETRRLLLQRCREISIALDFAELVTAVEQEPTMGTPTADSSEEESSLTLEDMPHEVATMILHDKAEQRQQVAQALEEAQQQLPAEAAPLSRFLRSLVAVLRDETPDSAALEVPFTDLWQAFLDELKTGTYEQKEEKEENDA